MEKYYDLKLTPEELEIHKKEKEIFNYEKKYEDRVERKVSRLFGIKWNYDIFDFISLMPGYPILWDWAEYWMSIRKVYAFRFYFESLDVKETFKSAETELRDIIYKPENHSELFKHLKNKYDLPEDTTCRIRLKHSSGTIYGISILMKSKDKAVQIDLMIFKQ